ncbi:hypothetical protein [Ideonella sp.]|uniref:hypothetical protein n=1 Tax=Ideonella sp. TaxID=1929293 RepID=UPI003BB77306
MRILLIAPAFYDYHSHIIRELERRGHSVRFFAERPARWIYSPAKKLPAAWRERVFASYFRGVLAQIRNEHFDKILLIRGEIVRPWFLEALRLAQPAARLVMYQWDSLRVVNFKPLLPLVDAVATFDSVDARELNLPYLPLFHIPPYRLQDAPTQLNWDLVFVGSFHDARYRTMKAIQAHCAARGIRFHHHLYLSPVDYLKLKLLSAQPPAREDVTFQTLDQASIVALYRDTAAILDIENHKQTGLTMRTFEALATGRFLVTTNPLAAELLPELESRIVSLDRQSLDLNAERLRHPPGWEPALATYSLESWAGHLLDM